MSSKLYRGCILWNHSSRPIERWIVQRNGYSVPRCHYRHFSDVRVRFAPSPTGFIHLGGLRTAFYNYLFAKKHNGKFILRVEDTDQERVVPGSLESIIDTLKWSQLLPDEGPSFGGKFGPYIQSERVQIYNEMLEQLLKTKSVYRCFCTSKRLELLRREAAKNRETIKYDNRCRSLTDEEIKRNLAEGKSFTIRLRLKNGPITVPDMVYGPVMYDLSRIEGDPIMIKSDGLPTYHFANVVDDHLMQITHVLRGVEWLVSTPKHLMLYEAFGWPTPRFAHLPLIINKDGSKLSKRHDHIRISTYQNEGYYPATITNYLTQMGGGFSSLNTVDCDRLYSMHQLTTAFDLHSVNQNNCRIDVDKVKLLNRLSIKNKCETNIEELVGDLKELLTNSLGDKSQSGELHLEDDYVRQVVRWSLDRIYSLQDLVSEEFLFAWTQPTFNWHPKSVGASGDTIVLCLSTTIDLIRTVEPFEEKEVLARIRVLHQQRLKEEIAFGKYMKLLRLALTNLKVGPPVAEVINLLGRDTSIQYLTAALDHVHNLETHRKIAR